MEQTVLHREFIPCLAAARLSKKNLGVFLQFSCLLRDVSLLLVHPNWKGWVGGWGGLRSLHVAYRKLFSSWQSGKEGDGPGRTINRVCRLEGK